MSFINTHTRKSTDYRKKNDRSIHIIFWAKSLYRFAQSRTTWGCIRGERMESWLKSMRRTGERQKANWYEQYMNVGTRRYRVLLLFWRCRIQKYVWNARQNHGTCVRILIKYSVFSSFESLPETIFNIRTIEDG